MRDQIAWTLAACSRIFRPVVRLALALGLKYAHLDGLLRELLMDEAARVLRAQGVRKPNISQIATATGLNRKVVTARAGQPDEALPVSEFSPAAWVFTAWLQLADDEPARKRLPIATKAEGVSFEALAREATRGNVHHRAVLDDLIRLGMVLEEDGHAELAADAFIPAKDLRVLLSFLGDNARDHLEAAVSNVLGANDPPMLERAVYGFGLTSEECARLDVLARSRWEALHHELVRELTESVKRSAGVGTQRFKVGIYVLHEEAAPVPALEGGDSSLAPPSTPENPT